MWWTLAGAFVAACTALAIAFRAYPWQKELDRQLKIAEEKRQAYQRFFDASEMFFAKLRTAAFSDAPMLPDDEFGKLEVAKTDLAFRGSDDAVKKCAKFAQHLKDYRRCIKLCIEAGGGSKATRDARDEAYRAANEARVDAILAARADAGTYGNKSASEDTVRRLFMMRKSGETQ